MNISFLSDKMPWFGKHSGYDCLIPYLTYPKTNVKVISSKHSVKNKIRGKLEQIFTKQYSVNSLQLATEITFQKSIKHSDISHILHIEGHIHLLEKLKHVSNTLIGTIHLPLKMWPDFQLCTLKKLKQAIILYEAEIDRFQQFINRESIHFIRHGINTDFFQPGKANTTDQNKILFVGHYLRNFEMMEKVLTALQSSSYKNLEYHFIIPSLFRKSIFSDKVLNSKNIFFHENLDDAALLEFYQTSNLMVMPMNDSGANSAIVQAIACGLPVITTDVGGIRSYGGGSVYPVITNNDHDAMIDLVKQYLSDTIYRNNIAREQRVFAEQFLDWKIIAKQHFNLYRNLHD